MINMYVFFDTNSQEAARDEKKDEMIIFNILKRNHKTFLDDENANITMKDVDDSMQTFMTNLNDMYNLFTKKIQTTVKKKKRRVHRATKVKIIDERLKSSREKSQHDDQSSILRKRSNISSLKITTSVAKSQYFMKSKAQISRETRMIIKVEDELAENIIINDNLKSIRRMTQIDDDERVTIDKRDSSSFKKSRLMLNNAEKSNINWFDLIQKNETLRDKVVNLEQQINFHEAAQQLRRSNVTKVQSKVRTFKQSSSRRQQARSEEDIRSTSTFSCIDSIVFNVSFVTSTSAQYDSTALSVTVLIVSTHNAMTSEHQRSFVVESSIETLSDSDDLNVTSTSLKSSIVKSLTSAHHLASYNLITRASTGAIRIKKQLEFDSLSKSQSLSSIQKEGDDRIKKELDIDFDFEFVSFDLDFDDESLFEVFTSIETSQETFQSFRNTFNTISVARKLMSRSKDFKNRKSRVSKSKRSTTIKSQISVQFETQNAQDLKSDRFRATKNQMFERLATRIIEDFWSESHSNTIKEGVIIEMKIAVVQTKFKDRKSYQRLTSKKRDVRDVKRQREGWRKYKIDISNVSAKMTELIVLNNQNDAKTNE